MRTVWHPRAEILVHEINISNRKRISKVTVIKEKTYDGTMLSQREDCLKRVYKNDQDFSEPKKTEQKITIALRKSF